MTRTTVLRLAALSGLALALSACTMEGLHISTGGPGFGYGHGLGGFGGYGYGAQGYGAPGYGFLGNQRVGAYNPIWDRPGWTRSHRRDGRCDDPRYNTSNGGRADPGADEWDCSRHGDGLK